MRLFVFGLGYSATAFIAQARSRFEWVGGTTRSDRKADELRASGIEPLLFDGETANPAISEALGSATHVLLSIAPGNEGDPALALHGQDIAAARPEWIGYLSTVGVYGDHEGAWVDEDTECRPVSRRSVLRVAAEEAWLDFAGRKELKVQIFRLSGIYGPGRNAFINLESGKAKRLIKPGQVFNRIHVADIAGAVTASLNAPRAAVYNVTDDEPCPPQDVVEYAARLMGVEPPPEIPFETADISPMARSFYGENKRVSNARLKKELGYRFRFPNYRVALDALYRDGWK